jgi:hypothetical protein
MRKPPLIFILALILLHTSLFCQEKNTNSSKQIVIETFKFSSNGNNLTGKIYLPASYDTNKNLPAIYLIDFTEQHFKLATDEFEKVIEGVQQLLDFDALVVSLDGIPDIDAEPESFQKHYEIYKDMATHIVNKYSDNPSRTFIGKGSEGGVVLMALFIEGTESSTFDNFIVTDPSPKYATEIIRMIKNENFPQKKRNKKLHFSFSTSNDRTKCTQLIRLINQAEYHWLHYEVVEYTESDYENTYPISYAAGIKYVYTK